MKRLQKILWLAALLLPLGAVTACSESDDEEAGNEYANWQARNDAFFASLADSLQRDPAVWKKIKAYSKDEQTEGANTDYIYAKVIGQDDANTNDGMSPIFSDSVRVAYRGRLIPSATYPEGNVFDQTFAGSYNVKTASAVKGVVGEYVDGFATALQYMKRGDYWRVYIPYTLGYGGNESGSIPAYSVLIFDLALIDFTSDGKSLGVWGSRQM